LPENYYHELAKQYRALANRELQLGRYRRAAYIFANLLHELHARGCVCALPVVAARHAPLEFRSWQPGAVLVTSRFGIAEPGPERPVVRPQHSLVPLLAFDDDGYRLGYGGGFYDRTLAALRSDGAGPFLAIGAALTAQRRAPLPREPFDARLDALVTEAGILRF